MDGDGFGDGDDEDDLDPHGDILAWPSLHPLVAIASKGRLQSYVYVFTSHLMFSHDVLMMMLANLGHPDNPIQGGEEVEG